MEYFQNVASELFLLTTSVVYVLIKLVYVLVISNNKSHDQPVVKVSLPSSWKIGIEQV